MPNTFTIYVPVREDLEAQLAVKALHAGFKVLHKVIANTYLIHYQMIVLVPESPDNDHHAGLFKKIKGAMLITAFDNEMLPYFTAFWENSGFQKTFATMKFFAKDPPPAKTGVAWDDYNNFERWILKYMVKTDGHYDAYPQSLVQIYKKWPDQNPTPEAPIIVTP